MHVTYLLAYFADSVTDVRVFYVTYPDDCLPTSWRCKYRCWERFLATHLGQRWWTLRCYANQLVDHGFFETFIILIIVASSVTLVKWNALCFIKERDDWCRWQINCVVKRILSINIQCASEWVITVDATNIWNIAVYFCLCGYIDSRLTRST